MATWVSGAARWIKRYVPGSNDGQWAESDREGRLMSAITLAAMRQRAKEKDRSRSNLWASRFNMGSAAKAGWPKLAMVQPELAKGFETLARMRCGNFRFATGYVMAGLLPDRYMRSCPCCRADEPETLEHLMVICESWMEERGRLLGVVLRAAMERSSDLVSVCALLLGGELEGERLVDWAVVRSPDRWEQSQDLDEADSTLSGNLLRDQLRMSETERVVRENSDAGVSESGCVAVARFLQEVVRKRTKCIWMLRSRYLASLKSRSPNG